MGERAVRGQRRAVRGHRRDGAVQAAVAVGGVGDGEPGEHDQQRTKAAQDAQAGLAFRAVLIELEQFAEPDEDAEDLLGGFQAQHALASAPAHRAAGVVFPGVVGGVAAGEEAAEVVGHHGELVVGFGDGTAGRQIGADAPDHHGEQQRPEAADDETARKFAGECEVRDGTVGAKHQHNAQQVPDLQRGGAIDPREAGHEHGDAGDRQ